MGGKVTSYLNPVKTFANATKNAYGGVRKLANGKGTIKDFVSTADEIGSLGLGNQMGVTRSMFPDKAAPMAAAPGGQSPTELLASTGGAPVLANIAMGVDPEEALAGFFGKSTRDGSWAEFLQNADQKDFDAIHAVHGQLTTIQQNTELRNKAVQAVINDYPNITAKIAQDRMASGQEFDDVTKGYMEKALGQTAAKFAAGGALSSGAANEAFAHTGADMALSKLDYMGSRESASRLDNMTGFNARLGEVNALRDFQNTMLGQAQAQGFSAAQANLGRIQQGNIASADFANRQNMADQQGQNAMMGSLGSLAGTVIGGYFGGPAGAAAGSRLGGEVGGSFNQNAPKTYTTSYGKVMGGN